MSEPLYLPSGRVVPVARVVDGRLAIESADDARAITEEARPHRGTPPRAFTWRGSPYYVVSVEPLILGAPWLVELEAVSPPPRPVRP